MDKREFLIKVPDIIFHRAHGESILKAYEEGGEYKACYTNDENLSSCYKKANSWKSLHDKMISHLLKEGYMKNKD